MDCSVLIRRIWIFYFVGRWSFCELVFELLDKDSINIIALSSEYHRLQLSDSCDLIGWQRAYFHADLRGIRV